MEKKLIWEKICRILAPCDIEKLGITHPIASFLEKSNKEDCVKIYFNARDKENRSELRSFLLNMKSFKISEISGTLFYHGKIGTFDEHGVEVCSVVDKADKKLLFYQGWNCSFCASSFCSIGLAAMEDNKINRVFLNPVLTSSLEEPAYDCAAPFVIKFNNEYLMYYSSVDKLKKIGDKIIKKYNIKIAISKNAVKWEKLNAIAIDYECNEEYAFGRPFVLVDNNIFKMWYCYKGKHYKIGYAESFDGINWVRRDELNNLPLSESGWDSEMIEYPVVFDYKDDRYMLFNGNGYGKTGMGLARLKR